MLEFKYDTQLLIEGTNLDEDVIKEGYKVKLKHLPPTKPAYSSTRAPMLVFLCSQKVRAGRRGGLGNAFVGVECFSY